MRERLIGIDAGGTMTKVVLFDIHGNELACERRPNVMLLPHEGWTERDPDGMWHAASEAMRALLEKTGTDPGDILAVTPSGYGGGVYFIDAEGAPVRNGLVSTDTRSIPLIERWKSSGLADEVSRHIEQQVWPGQTFPILAWFQENAPEVMANTRHVLNCKDFLRLRLCGDISTDPTDGGCAGILNVTRSDISREAFEAAGMMGWLDKLPDIRSSVEVVGTVTSAAAAVTGLRVGTPVVRGVYDVVGCALASGATSADQLAAVAGTFSIHSTVRTRASLNPLPTIQTPYPVNGQVLATTATPTSASNLEWLCKTMLSGEAERALLEGRSVYELCNDLVAAAIDRPNGILFFPFLYDGPRGAPGGFLGLRAGAELADIVRAVYEGVVFAHRFDMNYLLTGPDAADPKVIRLAGGPSRSLVWAQMFADGLGLPVEIANGSEFGAKGGAICAAVATGIYADVSSAIGNMVKVEQRLEPNAARAALLSQKYRAYLAAIDVVADLWSANRADQPVLPAPVKAPGAATAAWEETIVLELRNAEKVVGNETHIHATNLVLERGSLNVLLGPTLSGKTSLMRLMAGLDRPTAGSIHFDGVDVSGVRVQKRSVAMVYQQFINYPSMTVYENIASPLRIAGKDSATIDGEVRKAAELLRLTPYLQRTPLSLSGGQQQRTALARAIVKNARLVLLDEPLANLDYKLREELREELPRIFAASGAIFVYATTEPSEALLLGGNTATMHQGRVIQFGRTIDVYRQPADLVSAHTFADPPLNTISVVKRGNTFESGGVGLLPVPQHLQGIADGAYTLAFQPHHISLEAPVGRHSVPIRARALVSELSGSESFLHFAFAGTSLVLITHGIHDIAPDQETELFVSSERLMAFAPDGGAVNAPLARVA